MKQICRNLLSNIFSKNNIANSINSIHVLNIFNAAQQLFFATVPQVFIAYYSYRSLIVAVIAIFRIRFAGAYTDITEQAKTNTIMTHSIATGRCHSVPK